MNNFQHEMSPERTTADGWAIQAPNGWLIQTSFKQYRHEVLELAQPDIDLGFKVVRAHIKPGWENDTA